MTEENCIAAKGLHHGYDNMRHVTTDSEDGAAATSTVLTGKAAVDAAIVRNQATANAFSSLGKTAL